MAILKMRRMTLIGFNSERKAVLEMIHKYGRVQVNKIDTEEMGVEEKETATGLSHINEYMKAAQDALDVLSKYAPEDKGLFSSRKEIDISNYSITTTKADSVLRQCYEIMRLADKIAENSEDIVKIREKQTALAPYTPLDVPMQLAGTQKTVIKSGLLPGEWTKEKISESLADISEVYFEILSADKLQTSIWLMYHKDEAEKMALWEREIRFENPQFSLSHRVPTAKIDVLGKTAEKLTAEINECEGKIKDKAEARGSIQLLYDHMALRKEKYEALSKLGLTKNTFIMDGYIPEKYADKLIQKLEASCTVYTELYDEENEEIVPKQFENGIFASPVEGITETYSMPSPHDIDPNTIMAFFYYFFFGMMFSDAGYGLLVMLVCGILAFGKRLEPKKRTMFRMFFFCGISTTFWGLMYGSFFGDIIPTVAQKFFGTQVTLKPIWIDPVKEPLTLLIFSVAIGLLQIIVGLSIKFYMKWREKKYFEAIFDVGMWIAVLLGLSIVAAGAGLGFEMGFSIGIIIAAAGAVGLVLTQGRANKNIIAKLFGGIISLYDITSYVSDALSYSRLMALGLTTSVIASVVNILGSMGSGFVGAIMFVVIFIAGHLLNFAINMLGAYVHTNRLQYVEFFGKFYEGGGVKFKPLEMDTKYYRFTENEKKA